MPFVKALRCTIVLRRDPIQPRVTAGRSVGQAGIEQRSADALIAGSRVDEKIIHHENAIREQRVVAAVERGKSEQAAVGLGDELGATIRVLVESIE